MHSLARRLGPGGVIALALVAPTAATAHALVPPPQTPQLPEQLAAIGLSWLAVVLYTAFIFVVGTNWLIPLG